MKNAFLKFISLIYINLHEKIEIRMGKEILIFLFVFFHFQTFSQPNYSDSILSGNDITWLKENMSKLRYAPNPSWPPGDFVEDGIHKGIVADYIQIFEDRLNFSFQRVYYKNWDEIYNGLLDSKVDFVGAISSTPEREKLFAFTDVFLKIPLVILVRNDYLHQLSDAQIESMKLAAVKNYITQDYVTSTYKNSNISEFDDDLTALLQTSMGKTEGTIIDLMTASYLVQKYGINNLSIGKEFDYTWELRFAFRKECAQFAQIINSIFRTISENERLDIYQKWVNIHSIPTPNYLKIYFKYLLAFAILVFFAIVLFLYNNLILKNQVRKRTKELNKELIEKKIAINLSQKNEARLESLFEISRHNTKTTEELLDYALNEAVKLTESKLGLLYQYNRKDNVFYLSNYLNNETFALTANLFQETYTIEEFGTCGEIVVKKVPFQIDTCLQCKANNTGMCPLSKLQLTHTLIVPVIDDDELEAILFLANRTDDYDRADAKQLVLLMSSVWKLLNKQKWQEELIKAKAKAEESDQLKSAFLANLSHEIRTPMNGIIGFTELLKTPDLNSQKKDIYIDIIHKSSYYLLSVINDIIEISKIDSGLIHPNYNSVDIVRLINDIYENLSFSIPEDKEIHFSLSPSNIENGFLISTDKIKLRQVIENLISNAIKFTDVGRVSINYKINSNNEFEFSVKDTGAGIDEKYQKIIFERFRQGEREISIRKGGTGLGLAISKAYIEILKGTIFVKSELNVGSTFTFTIPIKGDEPKNLS